MKTTPRRLLAATVTGALALAGVGFATAAYADASQVLTGTIFLYGKSPDGQVLGSKLSGGSLTSSPAFYGITIDQGCPAGYRGRSDAGIWQNGARLGGISQARTPDVTGVGATGLDGKPVNMSDVDTNPTYNPYVANKAFSGLAKALQAGAFELRYYCSADGNVADYTTDKYYVLAGTANTDGTWMVGGAGPTATPTPTATTTPAAATTTGLSGTLTATNTATLTATVAASSGSAVPVGTVDFYEGTTKINSTSVAVDSTGKASFTTAVLSSGPHSFTAKYTPTDATKFVGSTSGAYTVQVPTLNSGYSYNVTVSIPSGAGSLRLSGYSAGQTIDLGQAKLDGTLFKAVGVLPSGLKVIDDRQVGASAWSLTGQDTDFLGKTDSTKSFDGGYLGWVPAVAGGDNNAPAQGAAGPEVKPISVDPTGGLKSQARVLAYGQVTSANSGKTTTTNVGAQLNLAVPQQTAGGDYVSVLTLTLS